MSKFYFYSDSELCYSIEYFYEYMKNNNLTEMVVNKAEKITLDDMFWCKEYEAPSEKGECSRFCEGYIPRNGKSGICKHYGFFYTEGEEIIIKLKEKNEQH